MFFNRWVFHLSGASLTAQLVKNIPAKNPQETPFDFWARKVCWRRNRAPTLVILGFPWGSAGKESTCNAENQSLIPGLGSKELLPTPVFCPEEFHGLYWTWDSPGQNTGVGSLSLLQEIFPTQRLNPGFPHCRWILYQLSYKGSLIILEWVAYPFSRGSSPSRNWTGVSCIAGRFFTNWAIKEAQNI